MKKSGTCPYMALVMQVIVITAFAILFAAIGRNMYLVLTDSPPTNWGITGRWFMMVLQGKFFTPSIANEPAIANEYRIGLMVHWGIGCLFSLSYAVLIQHILKMRFTVWNGVVYGLILAVFPLLIQLPSMGAGVLGLNTPDALQNIGRAIANHSAFGFGLGLGGIISECILMKCRTSCENK